MNETKLQQQKEYDISSIRADFPVLAQEINGQPLVYLDNAATTQKPQQVLAVMTQYYQHDNANIHRGVHTLSVRATTRFEQARDTVKSFLNAKHSHEIIFTKGTTESINLIATTFGRSMLEAGDEIILSHMEHHSNIVPWQIICEQIGANIKVVPVNDNGELDIDAFKNLISNKTKIVALAHVSNAIGTINPIEKCIEIAHQYGVPVLIDGAQAAAHRTVDVQALDCDFYVFSSHKLYGPTGVGVLYGKTEWLERLPPYQGGGDMITEVSFEGTKFNKLPHKFEAGTPNIAGVIGLASAINYLNEVGLANIEQHENKLLEFATESLHKIKGLQIIGQARHKAPVISFVMDGIHPHDIGTVLDHQGIAIRAGHHCAMPLMTRFNVPATARISFGMYNDNSDVTRVISALINVKRLFD